MRSVAEDGSQPHARIPEGSESTRALLGRIMRRQAALSLKISAVFIAVLLGLPLLNALAPELMAMRVGGFTLTWLLLAVLFYPLTWVLSRWFVSASDRIESEIVRDEKVEARP